MRAFCAVLSFLFGTVFASFAGVLAYRCPKRISIIKPNSYCPACNKPIAHRDNIPILSYLLLRGRCRHCDAKIGFSSFLSEAFGGVGFLSVYLMYGSGLEQLFELIVLWCLLFLFLVMAAIDLESHDVYNNTLVIFAVLALLLTGYRIAFHHFNVWNHLAGTVLGFAFFLSVALIGKLLLKRDALGSGDIYIAGIGGLLLGTIPLLLSIFLSTFLGSVIELCKIKCRKAESGQEIAFAPYLLFGIGVFAIFGEAIVDFFWRVVL